VYEIISVHMLENRDSSLTPLSTRGRHCMAFSHSVTFETKLTGTSFSNIKDYA